MSEVRVALVGAAIVAFLAWMTGWPGWFGFGALVVCVMFLNARDWTVFGREPGDEPTTRPPIAPYADTIDISEELVDLLSSAAQRSARSLEDQGRLVPFVMYEDAQGNVRVRPLDGGEPDGVLARAREAARSIDPTAPRVVLALMDVIEIDGRRRKVVRYEAAERQFRDRTHAFAHAIRPRRFVSPASTEGQMRYLGDTEHTLRFSTSAES